MIFSSFAFFYASSEKSDCRRIDNVCFIQNSHHLLSCDQCGRNRAGLQQKRNIAGAAAICAKPVLSFAGGIIGPTVPSLADAPKTASNLGRTANSRLRIART
jgi:hypothetical protein